MGGLVIGLLLNDSSVVAYFSKSPLDLHCCGSEKEICYIVKSRNQPKQVVPIF